jgi:hypothetical protein
MYVIPVSRKIFSAEFMPTTNMKKKRWMKEIRVIILHQQES